MAEKRTALIPPDSPNSTGFAITPDDTHDLGDPAGSNATGAFTWGIFVGGAGNLKVDLVNGGTVTFTGMLVGTFYPLRIKRVYATGTSATLLIGLY